MCDVHVTQCVELMQMHSVMNYTAGYHTVLWNIIAGSFHISYGNLNFQNAHVGEFSDKKPNIVPFDLIPFQPFLSVF